MDASDQPRGPTAASSDFGDSQPPNILLVEDDPKLAAMLSDRLTARRYRVWHVATAAEADKVVDEVQPDLMILDLMLPDRNGLLLCAELKERAHALGAEVPARDTSFGIEHAFRAINSTSRGARSIECLPLHVGTAADRRVPR